MSHGWLPNIALKRIEDSRCPSRPLSVALTNSKAGVTETNSVTGVAWYRREDWSRLREIASDRTKLDDSYEAWLAGAQKTLLELAVAGVAAKRVNVDVEALVRWCRAEGRPVDSAARAAFVADQLQRADQGLET